MRAYAPSSEVERARWSVEQPRVGVPLVDGRRDAAVSARHALDCGSRLCAGDGRLRSVFAPAFGGSFAADVAGEVECMERVVLMPASTIPTEPPPPDGDEAKIGGVQVGEPQR